MATTSTPSSAVGRLKWDGAVVLVTGASRGIGRAVASAASAKGAKVGLVARSETELRSVLDDIGGRGAIAVADVSDRDQAERAVAQVASELGPVDIVVANAGIGQYGPFIDVDPAEFERLIGVNVLGTMYVVHAALPSMVERRRGHVVVIGSIAGRIGSPFESVYAATKFAQVGFTEAIAVELSAFGIGVSMVNPGPVATTFFDTRGSSYQRRFPRQVPAAKVADAVIRAVERGRLEQVVPRWLGSAVAFRHLVPPLFMSGTRGSFKQELAALRNRTR